MFKSIFNAVAVSTVAAFFCVGCGGDDGGDDNGGGNETKAPYTITFNANGGTVNPTSAKTGDDGKLASLPTPTRSGYTFDGWFTAATGGTAVTVSNVYSANATIYARWTAEPVNPSATSYTITFDASGGTVNPMSAKTGDDGKLAALPEPTREGYTFDGWYTAATGGTAVTVSRVYTANATIYARWTAEVNYISKGSDISNYKTIVIGTQKWMAENLDNDVAGSVCYGDDSANCAKYGRLYDWNTALTACPAGYHLPSADEWTTLVDYAGGFEIGGAKLKSRSGWERSYMNGGDAFGFSGLPGGSCSSTGCGGVGEGGSWWSSDEVATGDRFGWRVGLAGSPANDLNAQVIRGWEDKEGKFSVRCVAD